MKKLRRIIFWCHLTAGVTAGVVILIMSVTGVLLAFERQVIRFAERDMLTVGQPPKDARLTVGTLLSKVSEVKPDAKPSGLTLQSDPTAAATVALGRDGVLYLNPYTGEVLGQGARRTRAFFRVIEDWHRWLGTGGENRAVGRAITGACNTAFLVLAITGVYLWWPKKWTWKKVRPVVFFQHGLKDRARNFNWHNTAGFWSSSLLIIITATGMVLSYQWANNLLYRLTGTEPPAQQGPQNRAAASTPGSASNERPRTAANQVQPGGGADRDPVKAPRETGRPEQQSVGIAANLDRLWTRAEQQASSWQSITLRLPVQPNAPVVFSIREGKAWLEAASSQLTLQPTSAEVMKWEPYGASSAGRKARTWARFLHTGEAGGVPGQILAFLASLGGSLLVWTGLALVLRRFRAWVKRRKASAAESEHELGLFDARPEQTHEG
ncbi:MAG: PepSY domain-containing protein [Pyrinomonadaceae bacterium]|nr:PepSY domain-containing protein [Pyrinomonadaceae bacterium]